MGQALYRKYRSKSFDEVVGQDHITKTLSRALKKGNISHAYLFFGPRGVGKTSIARILAHAVNDLPYDDESSHLDIIEIDAASNRRIDEIRELREKVHNAPSSAKYKVYIIDEVHMLTREAFNALLKTLEEPPEHAIFILATTEAHKLPETIISRSQRYSFKPVAVDQITGHLRTIAEKENMVIDDEALGLIAQQGDGSFRDSIGLLDQVRGLSDTITAQEVRELLGVPPEAILQDIISSLASGDKKRLVELLGQLIEQGYLATHVAKQLSALLRTQLIDQSLQIDEQLAGQLLKDLLDVPLSHDPHGFLEIILLTGPAGQQSQPTDTAPEPPQPTAKQPEAEPTPKSPVKDEVSAPADVSPSDKKSNKPHGNNHDDLWQQALKNLKQKYNTLYSIARMASPEINEETLVLHFDFSFHKKQFDDEKNRRIFSEILTEVFGKPLEISCIVNKKHQPAAPVKTPVNDYAQSPPDNISNIFGGGEVIQ